MCGIVGLYLKNKKYNKDLGKFLTGMMNNMSTRGPDSAGFAIYSTERKKKYKYSICYNENNIKEIKKNLIKEIKDAKIKISAAEKLLIHLGKGELAITIENLSEIKSNSSEFNLITFKPTIYVCNVNEESIIGGNEFHGTN